MKYKLILILIILSSCQFLPQQTEQRPETYIGTEGISLNAQLLLDKIFPNQETEMIVTVMNNGAYDISEGYMNLITEEQFIKEQNIKYYDSQGNLEENKNEYSIQGRGITKPYGDQVRFKYILKAQELPQQTERYSSLIIAQTCYPYKTYATIPVCIDTDINNMNPDKICKSGSETITGGQGAPIAITRVETKMVPEYSGNEVKVKPHFEIDIENVGSGSVIKPTQAKEACEGKSKDIENIVGVKVIFNNIKLDCAREYEHKLVKEKTTLKCKLPDKEQIQKGTYKSLVKIELDYAYTTTGTANIEITQV